jgi:tetratricopeptide (TPR) repeat protein
MVLLATTQVSYSSEVSELLTVIEQSSNIDQASQIKKLSPHLQNIRLEPPQTQFRFYALLAIAHGQLDNLTLAHRYHMTADQIAPKSVQADRLYLRHLRNWAGNYYEAQELQEGLQLVQRLYRLTSRHSKTTDHLRTLNLHLMYVLAEEKWKQARRIAEQAITIAFSDATKYDSVQQQSSLRAATLQCAARLYQEFDPAKAIELFEMALVLDTEQDIPTGIETSLHYLAILYAESGKPSQSRKNIAALKAFAKKHNRGLAYLSAYTTSSKLHLQEDSIDEAHRDILRAEIHLTHDVLPSLHQRFLLQKAKVLQHKNETDTVVKVLAGQKELFANSPQMKLKLQYYELLGNAYALKNNPKFANEALQEALKLSTLWRQKNQVFGRTPSYSAKIDRPDT